jgi:hypothetical protein
MLSLIRNIQTNSYSELDKAYFRREYVDLLEDHRLLLQSDPRGVVLAVEPIEAVKYRFDLYQFLKKKTIPMKVWTAIQVANGIKDSQDFGPDSPAVLFIPSESIVEDMYTKYKRNI